jgi:hypothetical protein
MIASCLPEVIEMPSPAEVPQPDDAAFRMFEMICGKWISQAIAVASELNVADLLAHGPRAVEDLAAVVNCRPDMLNRLLRALASVGIFARDPDGRYRLTALAEKLRSDVPDSMRGLAVMEGCRSAWDPYARLLETVRTGETAFRLFHGLPLFDFMRGNPEFAGVFGHAMRGLTKLTALPIVSAYDFTGIGTIADIGGGQGQFLSMVLRAHPIMTGILFDLEQVVSAAQPFLRAEGVAGRVTIVSGDFFERIPPHADAYMLKHILHDWDDREAHAILRRIRDAISSHARLLIVEAVIADDNTPGYGKLLDLEMMAVAGGRERTLEQYEQLTAGAGFRLVRVTGKGAALNLLEAEPC